MRFRAVGPNRCSSQPRGGLALPFEHIMRQRDEMASFVVGRRPAVRPSGSIATIRPNAERVGYRVSSAA
jgi:hypothetical protein